MENNESLQLNLAESFKNAIKVEQESDVLLTNSYLEPYSPKQLCQLGLAIINLIISNVKTGLGGRTLIELELDPSLKGEDDGIQLGTLRVGDVIKLDRMSNSNSSETIKIKKAQENSSKKEKIVDSKQNNESLDAVIIKISSKSVTVSVEEDSSDEKILNFYNNTSNENARMWIVKLSNSITYKRMISTMNKLKELKENEKTYIIQLLLGETKYNASSSSRKMKDKDFFNPDLNKSQKEAINFAINESPITIIHGPPGTGKTYTLIELIKQLTFNHNEKVLVCGPSNISVDTILERLSPDFSGEESSNMEKKKSRRSTKQSYLSSSKNPEKLIRIGHPARLLTSNLKHSLDILSKANYNVGSNDNKEILKDIEQDISETLGKIKKCKRYSERKILWSDLKMFKKELRVRERKIVQDLLVGADVILSTLHGAGSYELSSIYKESSLNYSAEIPFFDTIIIDEVSQSLEPQCWIPLINHLGFKRLVIAGDNMQLPPTIKSKDHIETLISKLDLKDHKVANLETTLFDRLVMHHDGNLFKKLLDTQYRMNESIMRFPSIELYQGELLAHESVSRISLINLPNVENNDDTSVACIWYDTQGGDFPEKSTDDNNTFLMDNTGSTYNEMEVLLVHQHLKKLLKAGVPNNAIGIISPYNAQVFLLKKMLQSEDIDQVEISTVDGFQGREKEVIIVSLVRSNDNRDVGFLKDKRRLNVAMTRPKRQLCVIGDLELMNQSGIKYLADWSNFVVEEFEIRYPDLGDY